MNTKVGMAAVLFSAIAVAAIQAPACAAAPTPPATRPVIADDVAARLAARRAQQLNQQPPAAPPFSGPAAAISVPPASPNLPAAATPSTLPADPRWQSLIAGLSSDSFSEREAAQKELEKVSWREHDTLKQLADAVSDPEAKSRLAGRVEEIEEQIILSPPPISLDVKAASLNDLVTALEKATGEKFSDPNQRGFNNQNALFTLSVKDKPFWEVIRDLNDQHPLQIQGYNGLRIYQQSPGMRPSQIIGGVAIFAQSISRTATVNLENEPGQQVQPPSMSIQYTVALDPRMKIARYQQPRLTEVRDDAGNVLLNEAAANIQFGWNNSPQYRVWSTGQSLAIPEKLGKKIVSAKGELRLSMQLASETLDVTEVEKKLNQPLTVGGVTALITKFDVRGNLIEFNISQRSAPQQPNGQEMYPTSVTFIDANGQQVWTGSLNTSGSVGGNNIVGPVKVRIAVTTKTKDVTIPFEFKNLPLP